MLRVAYQKKRQSYVYKTLAGNAQTAGLSRMRACKRCTLFELLGMFGVKASSLSQS